MLLHPHRPSSNVFVVEPPEDFLHFRILNLHRVQGFLYQIQALLGIGFINCSCFVLVLAVVLDFLTRIFDFVQPQGRRRSFEEMTGGAKFRKISVLPGMPEEMCERPDAKQAGVGNGFSCSRGEEEFLAITHNKTSIFLKVASACSKNP